MTINVLGLGRTVSQYQPNETEISIGVNDINKFFETDYFVCVDKPQRFSAERLGRIINHDSKMFTHLKEWEKYRGINLIELANGRGNLKQLDSDLFAFSHNSTFVAVVLAYKLGADKIKLYGVDFNNHPAIKDLLLESSLKDFKSLNTELLKRGVELQTTKESRLSEFLPTF